MATFDGVEEEPVGGTQPWSAMRAGLRKLGAASWFTAQSVNILGASRSVAWVASKFNNREIKVNYAHK